MTKILILFSCCLLLDEVYRIRKAVEVHGARLSCEQRIEETNNKWQKANINEAIEEIQQ